MVVYGAFSGAVVAGLWTIVSWQTLLILDFGLFNILNSDYAVGILYSQMVGL